MLSLLVQLFIKIFVIKADNDYSYEVHEPTSLNPLLIKEIETFRARLYNRKAPYLLAPTQIEIEKKLSLDERSYQVIARRKSNGELVGTLRLTPYPFEVTELTTIDFNQPEYLDKLEIGRLLTDPSVRNVGKKIMILGGIHIVENTDFKGFLGVVRAEKIKYFKNFGMQVISDKINLKGRPHDYLAIISDFKTMRQAVRTNILKNITVPLSSALTRAKYE